MLLQLAAALLLAQAAPAQPTASGAGSAQAHPQNHPAQVLLASAQEPGHETHDRRDPVPAREGRDVNEHGATLGHEEAAPGEHGTAAHGEGHGEAEHGGSVAEHIFHHVQDEVWVPLNFYVGSRHFDLSITKHVVWMWVSAGVLLLVFGFATRKRAMVPKGLYNMLESIVQFIRDEIAVKQIGHDAHHYVGYLCTAFFFIFVMNLIGLIPFTGTATGNLAVTVVLAGFTFVITQLAGMRAQGAVGYWAHLVPSGVPAWLWPIMLPVELLGLFTKPFALTVRLFANMVAGHIVIYFLLALTLIISTAVAPVSVGFALGIYMLELFVALVQAYVFTMLSAVFIGMAAHSH